MSAVLKALLSVAVILSASIGISLSHAAPNDLNGDGKSDLLIRNSSNGQIEAYLMNGTTITARTTLMAANAGWSITHTADLNGDGQADLLWQHPDGQVAVWLMNGTTPISGAILMNAGLGWSISHTADLNGDGKADILWKHPDGRVAAWLMNGTTPISGAALMNAGLGWSISHTADLNGDGKADLLWKHPDGRVAAWLMNGTTPISGAALMNTGTGWSVSHTPDLNGDGKADLLWRHTDGSVATWLMNGLTTASGAILLGASTGWSVSHTPDLNGDGKADLLWRHTDGSVAAWLMNGLTPFATPLLLGANTGWTVTHTPDLNGDGKADLLWRQEDGSVAAWLMNGTAPFAAAPIIAAGNLYVVPGEVAGSVPVGASEKIYYVHTDHLGTPRAITRSTDNQVVWTWENAEAFGNNAPNENPSNLGTFTYNLRMPGQYFDKETNTFYNYFRDYDPATGRYVQSDPVGIYGGLSTYGYVANQPLGYADPSGLTPALAGACFIPGVGWVGCGVVALCVGVATVGTIGVRAVMSPSSSSGTSASSPITIPVVTVCSTPETCESNDRCGGLRNSLKQHEEKLRNYINNPLANDNTGILGAAYLANEGGRAQSIYDGRIAKLKGQIETFKKDLAECESKNGKP